MRLRSVKVVVAILVVCVPLVLAQAEKQTSPSEKNPKAMEIIKRALLLESAMMYKSAIDAYKEALTVEPKDFVAMNAIAGLYGKLGDFRQEVAWAKKSIDTNPKFFEAYVNYGNGLAQQGDFDGALTYYRKAAEIAPTDPLPIYSQGVVAEEQGFAGKDQKKLREALGLYKKSVELDAKFEPGLFSAAAMHANLKEFDEAKILLKKLLEINPKAEDARQMLTAIERDMAKP